MMLSLLNSCVPTGRVNLSSVIRQNSTTIGRAKNIVKPEKLKERWLWCALCDTGVLTQQFRMTFLVLRNQLGSHHTITHHQRSRHDHLLLKWLGMFNGINHQLGDQLAKPLAWLANAG